MKMAKKPTRCRGSLTARVGPVLPLLFFWGCQGTASVLEDEGTTSANEQFQAQQMEHEATTWPAGWMVVKQEEWIPVLDTLGRQLHRARGAYQAGDLGTAAANIRVGLTYLEAQVADANARDRAALESAIATLQAIRGRLSSEDGVTLEQLDIAFTNAYRFDLGREALVIQAYSAAHYLAQPDEHLQRAIERFLANETEDAAREIDRAAAYLRLEANRLDLAERAFLVDAAQELEHMAARMRLQEIQDRAELDGAFAPVRQRWNEFARPPAPAPASRPAWELLLGQSTQEPTEGPSLDQGP